MRVARSRAVVAAGLPAGGGGARRSGLPSGAVPAAWSSTAGGRARSWSTRRCGHRRGRAGQSDRRDPDGGRVGQPRAGPAGQPQTGAAGDACPSAAAADPGRGSPPPAGVLPGLPPRCAVACRHGPRSGPLSMAGSSCTPSSAAAPASLSAGRWSCAAAMTRRSPGSRPRPWTAACGLASSPWAPTFNLGGACGACVRPDVAMLCGIGARPLSLCDRPEPMDSLPVDHGAGGAPPGWWRPVGNPVTSRHRRGWIPVSECPVRPPPQHAVWCRSALHRRRRRSWTCDWGSTSRVGPPTRQAWPTTPAGCCGAATASTPPPPSWTGSGSTCLRAPTRPG